MDNAAGEENILCLDKWFIFTMNGSAMLCFVVRLFYENN